MLFSRFLKRLTGSLKIKWQVLFLELFIVFIGVYLAFLLNNYQENQKIRKEGEKIWSTLKIELEDIRLSFPQFAHSQKVQNEKWDSLFSAQEVGQIYTWRFIQPQYDFATIQYAIDTRESKIIDFDLYNSLTKLYLDIQKLEHTETLMTNTSLNYKNIHSSLPKNSKEFLMMTAENRITFYRFIDFAKIRAEILERIGEISKDILIIINQKLGKTKQIQLEKNYIRQRMVKVLNERPKEVIIQKIQKAFPSINTNEIAALYETAISQKEVNLK